MRAVAPHPQHPYLVLSQALHERRKWALGRVVLSGHRRLVLVRSANAILTLHVLHFPAQVRPSSSWQAEVRAGPIHPAEQDLAARLIDATAQPVVWSEYRDDRAEQMAALVRAAMEKRPLTPPPSEPVPVLPLLEALQQSVAAALRTQTSAPEPAPSSIDSGPTTGHLIAPFADRFQFPNRAPNGTGDG